jgi:FMN phosphatase YigB (HAD superfamily)
MNARIGAIIFDWGRTLFDSETKREFLDAAEVLSTFAGRGCRLALVSLVSAQANATLEERKAQIERSPLRHFFEFVAVTEGDKDIILDEAVIALGLPRSEILIVDDRTVRGIRYGNRHGHPTAWFQNGKFAEELPTEETGAPAYTIHSLRELTTLA